MTLVRLIKRDPSKALAKAQGLRGRTTDLLQRNSSWRAPGKAVRQAALGLALLWTAAWGLAVASPTTPILAQDAPGGGVENWAEGVPGGLTAKEADKKLRVDKLCDDLARKLGSIDLDRCLQAGLVDSGASSVRGHALASKEIIPGNLSLDTPRILLFGGIHGDEYSSVSIVFNWLELLDERGSGGFHWLVYPLLNPDGLLQASSQRMNARGVDLNRNFPTPDWLEATREYWVDRTGEDPRRYPGPAPLSEPETEWILREIHRFEPTVIISIHAPYKVLDFDGPPESAPQQIGPLRLQLLGTYPGSLGRYAGVVRRKPVVTLELPSAGILPPPEEQLQMWDDLMTWLEDRFPLETP